MYLGASENALIKVRSEQNASLKNGLPEEKALGERSAPQRYSFREYSSVMMAYILVLRKDCLKGTFMAIKRFSDSPLNHGQMTLSVPTLDFFEM